MRQAFARSLNAPAVHLAATLGVRRVIEQAKEQYSPVSID